MVMKICYLLESTELSGGVRVVFDQARVLAKKGHKVQIRALRGDHSWYPYPIDVQYVKRLDEPFEKHSKPEALVCTYWSTVSPGLSLNIYPTFHLCQGYEGGFPELESVHDQIEFIYRLKIPKITIGEWISQQLIERFGHSEFPIHCIGQIVDTTLYHPKRLNWTNLEFYKKNRKPRVLIVGDCFVFSKGIEDGLQAIERLRLQGHKLSLIRVSIMSNTRKDEQEFTPIDEYHFRLDPKQMASIYRRSDLLLAPNRVAEGFGLPFAEALASGVPAVATRIPSYLSFDQKQDYACFVRDNDYKAMAGAISLVLNDHKLRKKLQKKGPNIIRKRFDAESVILRLEQVIESYKRFQ